MNAEIPVNRLTNTLPGLQDLLTHDFMQQWAERIIGPHDKELFDVGIIGAYYLCGLECGLHLLAPEKTDVELESCSDSFHTADYRNANYPPDVVKGVHNLGYNHGWIVRQQTNKYFDNPNLPQEGVETYVEGMLADLLVLFMQQFDPTINHVTSIVTLGDALPDIREPLNQPVN